MTTALFQGYNTGEVCRVKKKLGNQLKKKKQPAQSGE